MPPSARHLAWDEIREACPDQYVVLDELEIDPATGRIRGGRLLAHAKRRAEVFALAGDLAGRSWALKWTGPVRIPPDWTGLHLAR